MANRESYTSSMNTRSIVYQAIGTLVTAAVIALAALVTNLRTDVKVLEVKQESYAITQKQTDRTLRDFRIRLFQLEKAVVKQEELLNYIIKNQEEIKEQLRERRYEQSNK